MCLKEWFMSFFVPFKAEQAGGTLTPTTYNPSDKDAAITLSGGDLTASISSASGTGNVFTIASNSSGKFYWETTVNSVDAGDSLYHGVAASSIPTGNNLRANSNAWIINNQGIVFNGTSGSTYTAFTATDVIMVAIDLGNTSIWFGRNGTWFNSGDPAANTGAIYTNLSGTLEVAQGWNSGGGKSWNITSNFGATAFNYTVPTGFNSGFGVVA